MILISPFAPSLPISRATDEPSVGPADRTGAPQMWQKCAPPTNTVRHTAHCAGAAGGAR